MTWSRLIGWAAQLRRMTHNVVVEARFRTFIMSFPSLLTVWGLRYFFFEKT